jgi:HEAT repeat protein
MAVERGTDAAIDVWAGTGLPGLLELRDVLAGAQRSDWDVSEREAIDNLSASTIAIAAANPAAFLEVFDQALDENTFVLDGLGAIDDPRATARLARAAGSKDRWVRMEAAIGLGRRQSPVASAALVELLADADSLVRFHALAGLAAVGDEAALRPLRLFAAPTPAEGQMAAHAVASIESRRNLGSDRGGSGDSER